MRAAGYAVATLITVSLFLIVATSLALAPVWTAAGSIGLALVAALAFVARTDAPPALA
jgi:hypothetical protein